MDGDESGLRNSKGVGVQKLGLTNDTAKPLEVMVEITPDRYVLQPGDEMVIEGGDDPSQPYFQVNAYDGGIQVYPPLWAQVSINRTKGEPVWEARPPAKLLPTMNIFAYSLVAGAVFGVVAIVHTLRSVMGWEVMIGGWTVPMWFSWIAVGGSGLLSFMGLRCAAAGRESC
jgi:hypothetical protein